MPILSYLGRYLSRIRINKSKKADLRKRSKIFYCGIMAVGLSMVNACKGFSVGIDTPAHYSQYIMTGNYSNLIDAFNQRSEEYGYVVLMYIANRLGLDFHVYIFCYTLFSMVLVAYVIYKYSKSAWMSYSIFIMYGLFINSNMGTVRQGIAMSLTFFAFDFIVQERLRPFLITMAVAFTFHTSVLIFLPFYWIAKIRFNKKTILVILGLVATGYMLRSPLMSVAKIFLNQKYESREAGGEKMYLFYLMILLGTIYIFQKLRINDKLGRVYLYSLALIVFFQPILSANPAYFRALYYYMMVFVLYVPYLISKLRSQGLKIATFAFFGGIGIYFMFTQIMPYSAYPYIPYWME